MPILAIPLFGDEVAPRFCVAESGEILLVEVGPEGVVQRERAALPGLDLRGRLEWLAHKGATVLLVCGFAARSRPLAQTLGIEVIWGLTGPVEELIEAYQKGDLDAYRVVPREGCPRRRRRGWAGGLRPCLRERQGIKWRDGKE